MARRKYIIEQIIVTFREIEVLCSQGETIAEATRQAEIPEQEYF